MIYQYERVIEARWSRMTEEVLAVQLGVGRALAQAFGKGNLPDLPEYDEVIGGSSRSSLPNWMKQFENANPGRAKISSE